MKHPDLKTAVTSAVTSRRDEAPHHKSSSFPCNSFAHWSWIQLGIDTSVSFSSMLFVFAADGLNVSGPPVKSQMNVTCFFSVFRSLFSLLTPRSVTTYLLQVADESEQRRSEQWDNCHPSFLHPRTMCSCSPVCVCVCVCVIAHTGDAQALWQSPTRCFVCHN